MSLIETVTLRTASPVPPQRAVLWLSRISFEWRFPCNPNLTWEAQSRHGSQIMGYSFLLVVIAAIACGIMVPQLADYASLVPFMIGFIIFLNFLELRIDYRRLFPKELFVTFLLSVIVMPVFVYYVLGELTHKKCYSRRMNKGIVDS
jgi:hypothetical protein